MILWVPSRLPGLNDLLNAKGTTKGSWNGYNAQKCVWYGQVALLCRAKSIQRQEPGYGTFLFAEPNMKRDPDNIVAGGVKLLLDSLVGADVLPGDGWRDNLGFAGYWTHRPASPGCLIFWGTEILTKEAMLALLEKELEKSGNPINRHRATGNEPHRAPPAKAARRRA